MAGAFQVDSGMQATGNQKYNSIVYVIAGIAALSGLLFGFDTGIISGALPFIDKEFTLLLQSPWLKGLMVSAVLIGALVGASVSGYLVDRYGRRNMLITTALLFLVASFTSALSPDMYSLLVSRFVVGFAIGVASFTAPLYLSEISPQHLRGALISLNQLAITIGILAAYLVNLAYYSTGNWRWMLGLGAVPAIILLIGMVFMPYSPRWMMSKGFKDHAREILGKIYHDDHIDEVFDHIEESLRFEHGNWRELLKPWLRPALVVGIGMGILQQFVGINAIIYYAPIVFKMVGFSGTNSSMVATVAVGVVNILMTVVAIFVVDRIGRRPLLLMGLTGMGFSMVGLALSFHLGAQAAFVKWLALGSSLVYISSFAVSLGILTWILIAEVFPIRNRGIAVSIAVAVSWGSNAIVSTVFPVLLAYIGPIDTFLVFAGICLVGFVYAFYFIPETKGCSLEKIEANLRAGCSARELGIPKEVTV